MNLTHIYFLSGVLPGDGDWPCAGDLDYSETPISPNAAMLAAWRRIADWPLPTPSDRQSLTDTLRALETSQPEDFGQGLLMAYGLYYSHPVVLGVIEQRSGYSARPPQPQGHPVVLPGLDERPLTDPKDVSWRADGTPQSTRIRRIQQTQPDREWTAKEIATWPTS